MSFFKQIALTAVLSVSVAMPAFATEAPVMPAFSVTEIQMLFEHDAKPMQLAALSQVEMKETEGAVLPYAVYGVTVGGRLLYVGLTRNFAAREAAHLARFGANAEVRPLIQNTTFSSARRYEQGGIDWARNNGVQLQNRINSISTQNPRYQHYSNHSQRYQNIWNNW